MQRCASRFVARVPTPAAMYDQMLLTTKSLQAGECTRNFAGTIDNMRSEVLVVPTDLFDKGSLEFYSKHNLDLISPKTNPDDYEKYYSESRGGEQGDYRDGIQAKVANVVDCLQKFPGSKRAVLSVPHSSAGTKTADHTATGEAKCLRELHFYIEGRHLHCSGFMRAQAVSIFPKNIHFIGTLMEHMSTQLGTEVGEYNHFVTTLVTDRS